MVKVEKRFLWKQARNDSGWTLIEALISVVLISLIFLGFAVSLLSFREWIDRSWAIRVLDQYANDVLSNVDSLLRTAKRVDVNPPVNGLGSFTIKVLDNYTYHSGGADTLTYTFSAHPTVGVLVSEGNAVPAEFYHHKTRGKEIFPPRSWDNNHEFEIADFGFESFYDPYLPENFNRAIAQIYLTIDYRRTREFEGQGIGQDKVLTKQYRISSFLKNYIESTE